MDRVQFRHAPIGTFDKGIHIISATKNTQVFQRVSQAVEANIITRFLPPPMKSAIK